MDKQLPAVNGAAFDLQAMETVSLSEKGVQFPVMRIDRPSDQLMNRDGSPVFITVLGPDSTTYRRTQQEVVRRRMEDAAAGGKMDDIAIASRSLDDTIEVLAAVTLDWTFRTPGGDAIPCNPVNAAHLYRSYPAIRDQMDARVSRRANFLQASQIA